MSDDFKPATRPLLRLAGLDGERPYVSRADETDALWTAVLALLLRLYLTPDAEARRAAGFPDAQVVAGLRAALAENFGLEAADYLAWALVQYGCRQKPTLASLPSWEALMFDWQERNATAPRVALMVRAAGLGDLLDPAALEALDGWIAQPATALGQGPAIPGRLFGARLVTWPLDEAAGEAPAHDALFTALVRSVPDAPAFGTPHQRRLAPTGARWAIDYAHDGRDWSFEADTSDGALDAAAVMRAVDALFIRVGRTERVFRLGPGRPSPTAPGCFVVADELRFAELCLRLRVPLLRDPRGNVRIDRGPGAAVSLGRPPAGAPAVGDAMPEAPVPAPVFAVEAAPDGDMKSLLASLRRAFGAGRLLQAGRWVRQSRAEPPAWILAQADPVGLVYDRMEALLRKGRLVWAAPVLVDAALRRPGEGDLPLVLLTSDDAYYDARPAALAAMAARLAAMRRQPPEEAELRELAERVRNDSDRPLGVPLPAGLGGQGLVLTSAMGIRAHLPGGVLSAAAVPLLVADPASEGLPMILPCALWTSGLRAAWDEGRLGRLA